MTHILIGALTIGQSPRPDLTAPLMSWLPETCRVLQAGALDGLTSASFPQSRKAIYPLTTRMQNGQRVVVEESYLASRLQQALNQLEEAGVVATILLCAGTFADLKGTRALFKPFSVGRAVLDSLGLKKIGLIAPMKEQEAPIRQRWQAAGFEPIVWTADLAQQDKRFVLRLNERIEGHDLDCIVLDYVGHPGRYVAQLRDTATVPTLDLGQLAMAALSSVL